MVSTAKAIETRSPAGTAGTLAGLRRRLGHRLHRRPAGYAGHTQAIGAVAEHLAAEGVLDFLTFDTIHRSLRIDDASRLRGRRILGIHAPSTCL